MAFQLAEAFVALTAKGFNTVGDAIGGIKSKLGGLVSFATGPLAVAFAGLSAGASVAGMVSLAASAEQTETQFKTLLGSVDAASSMITDLQAFGASTPFEFPGLADAAKSLLAFTVSSDQILPTLQVLGDVASATGNDIGALSQIYGKVASGGRLMTDSLDQFNERGVPVAKLLAESMGKTGAEIRQMASEGKLSFGDLQNALVGMTSEGGIAFGSMDAQAKTLSGLWSTLSDNVTMLMTSIGTAIVEGFDIKGVVNDFSGFVATFSTEWMPSIVTSIQWMSANIFKPFMETIGWMADLVMEFVADSDLWWNLYAASLANGVSNMWQTVSTFFENALIIGTWWYDNIIGIFTNIYNNVGKIFGNLIQQLKNNWQSLLDFITTGELKFDFSPLVDNLKLAMKGIEGPKLKTPEMDLLQGDMDRIAGQMANRQTARNKARADREAQTHKTKVDQLKIEDDAVASISETAKETAEETAEENDNEEKTLETEQKITKEKQKQSMSFASLADLADKMQESLVKDREQGGIGAIVAGGADIGAAAPQRPVDNMQAMGGKAIADAGGLKVQIDALRQQVTLLQALLALASGSGIKIATQGGVSVPSASIQFGATGA